MKKVQSIQIHPQHFIRNNTMAVLNKCKTFQYEMEVSMEKDPITDMRVTQNIQYMTVTQNIQYISLK